MRLLFTLLACLSAVYGYSQACFPIELEEVVILDASTYPATYELRYRADPIANSSPQGFRIIRGSQVIGQGQYGQSFTLGPFNCEEPDDEVIYALQDVDRTLCSSVFQLRNPINLCGTGDCRDAAAVLTGPYSECDGRGPTYEIQRAAAPATVIVQLPGGDTRSFPVNPNNRLVNLSSLTAPGDYLVSVRTGNGCEDFLTSFFINPPCTGVVRGVSWLDRNANGLRDPGEPPHPARLTLSSAGEASSYYRQVETEADGTYAFTGVPRGFVQLTLDYQDDFATTTPNIGDNEGIDSDPTFTDFPIMDLRQGDVTNTADVGYVGRFCPAPELTIKDYRCATNPGRITVAGAENGTQYTLRRFGQLVATNATGIFEDLTFGDYTVDLLTSVGCRSSSEIARVRERLPSLEIAQRGSFCNRDSLPTLFVRSRDLTPGEIVSYDWSNATTDSTIMEVEAFEEYEVTITLTDGCAVDVPAFYVEPSQEELNLPDLIQLDCATGLASLDIPSYYDDFEINYQIDVDFVDDTSLPIVLSSGGIFTVDILGELCTATGFSTIEDGFLGDFYIKPFESCGEPVTSLLLYKDSLELLPGLTLLDPQIEWFGPGLEDSFDGTAFIDGTPGEYGAIITTYCGSTTVTYQVVPPGGGECGGGGPEEPMNFSGRVVQATDNVCSSGPSDVGIPGVLVLLRSFSGSPDTYVTTDAEGRFTGTIPRGSNYFLSSLNHQGSFLIVCETINLEEEEDQDLLIYAKTPTNDCADLDVNIISPRFRRCFDNRAAIRYGNYSGVEAENTVLEVYVDSLFEDITASQPFTREGNLLSFEVGDMPAFTEAYVYLDFTVSCESNFGQLHCLFGEFNARNECDVDNGEALVVVEATGCTGDSLSFLIFNAGPFPTSGNWEYYVYEDGVQNPGLSVSRPPLGSFDSVEITYPADGTTVMLVAKQSFSDDRMPRYPSATIVGCGGEVPGFATIGGDAGISGEHELCRTNTGSFDPNEKLVFPSGVNGMNNDIEPGTRLTYELHFQNTGTDTAFTVVIRDTLPEALELSTIEFGAASHHYEVAIENGRELVFTFDNINLVDSFTNVTGSMGVVSFTIDHNANLQRGDSFRNRAGIFFDFNEPIITEYANTRIAPLPPMVVSTRQTERFDLPIALSPNPVRDLLRVELPGPALVGAGAGLSIEIVDGFGRVLRTVSGVSTASSVDVAELPSGVYTLGVRNGSQLLGRARFLVVR